MKLFTPGLIRSEIIHSVESDLSDLVGASHLGVLALDTLLPLSRLAWVASRLSLESLLGRSTS